MVAVAVIQIELGLHIVDVLTCLACATFVACTQANANVDGVAEVSLAGRRNLIAIIRDLGDALPLIFRELRQKARKPVVGVVEQAPLVVGGEALSDEVNHLDHVERPKSSEYLLMQQRNRAPL